MKYAHYVALSMSIDKLDERFEYDGMSCDAVALRAAEDKSYFVQHCSKPDQNMRLAANQATAYIISVTCDPILTNITGASTSDFNDMVDAVVGS